MFQSVPGLYVLRLIATTLVCLAGGACRGQKLRQRSTAIKPWLVISRSRAGDFCGEIGAFEVYGVPNTR